MSGRRFKERCKVGIAKAKEGNIQVGKYVMPVNFMRLEVGGPAFRGAGGSEVRSTKWH